MTPLEREKYLKRRNALIQFIAVEEEKIFLAKADIANIEKELNRTKLMPFKMITIDNNRK